MDNGYQIEWRSIDTQNQENFVVQPWHEFLSNYSRVKIFIIMEAAARSRKKHTRIYSKPPIFSFKQQWKNFYNQIVHEVHIKIPASLIIHKLAFDNKGEEF